MQQRDEQDRDGLFEVNQFTHLWTMDQLLRVARVGMNRQSVGYGLQYRLAMRDRHRFGVDVHHPRPWICTLRNLVNGTGRGNSRADVEKLVDACVNKC